AKPHHKNQSKGRRLHDSRLAFAPKLKRTRGVFCAGGEHLNRLYGEARAGEIFRGGVKPAAKISYRSITYS
ncbi:MAG: hypothetical protein JW892_02575, partial [Anaerolineae bacterium]|nr:hypothetical protein [Anaerolineae bacterium]